MKVNKIQKKEFIPFPPTIPLDPIYVATKKTRELSIIFARDLDDYQFSCIISEHCHITIPKKFMEGTDESFFFKDLDAESREMIVRKFKLKINQYKNRISYSCFYDRAPYFLVLKSDSCPNRTFLVCIGVGEGYYLYYGIILQGIYEIL